MKHVVQSESSEKVIHSHRVILQNFRALLSFRCQMQADQILIGNENNF